MIKHHDVDIDILILLDGQRKSQEDIAEEKYRKKGGYSKTLKKIYINWSKKRDYKYVSGHVRQGIAKTFSNDTETTALKVPPHSIEAEQAVLGGIFLDKDAWDKVADKVHEDDFYRKDHQIIFSVISKLNQNGHLRCLEHRIQRKTGVVAPGQRQRHINHERSPRPCLDGETNSSLGHPFPVIISLIS